MKLKLLFHLVYWLLHWVLSDWVIRFAHNCVLTHFMTIRVFEALFGIQFTMTVDRCESWVLCEVKKVMKFNVLNSYLLTVCRYYWWFTDPYIIWENITQSSNVRCLLSFKNDLLFHLFVSSFSETVFLSFFKSFSYFVFSLLFFMLFSWILQ